MSRRSIRGRAVAISVAVTSLLITSVGVGAISAGADPVTPAAPVPTDLSKTPIALSPEAKISPALKTKTGKQAVYVTLAGSGAADVSKQTLASGQSAGQAQADANATKAAVEATSAAVEDTAQAVDGTAQVLYQTTNSVPGVALVVDNAAALAQVAARPDVVKIQPLSTHKVSNASAAQLTKALNVWQSTGVTGAGVKIGIIDTGIDYTHADFGGAGTPQAFLDAQATSDATTAWTPTAKVVGGYDFVGDNYNADPSAADYQPIPNPNPNPLDCEGHGSHVAGTAAGYGVSADGTTFTGDYSQLTGDSLYSMKIGPGMAPQADLYALKVFGCTGSTNATALALDWALDPNGDGDFTDHLDIVNLSLGSDYAPADDPDNAIVDELANNGVLSVIAAGNNGDLTDTGGSPGNAISALTAASSVDELDVLDGIIVTGPPELAGTYSGQVSVAYPWRTAPDVSGTAVTLSTANNDGCDPLSAGDAAKVKGKVAFLEWDDNNRRCGSVQRSANVKAAGAVGAIFTNASDSFTAGITGDTDIPVFQLTKTASDTLRPAAAAGTLAVTFTGSLLLSQNQKTPSQVDTISSFTSRGTHGAPGVVKPDVAAPGQSLLSVQVGSGNGAASLSGTSMATPVTAGISALVKKVHPTWNPEQIKAAIMNTAGNDLFTGPNKTGTKYGPARVGAGRIDANAATTTTVLAYNKDIANAVSVSFGAVEAPATKGVVTKSQKVTVQNTGTSPAVLSLSYQGIVKQPGVSYAVSPSAVSVKAGGTATVNVTMTVITASLRKTIDPTMKTTQLNPYTGGEEYRQYVSDASGRLLVKPQGKPALRVPVYGAAKPVSTTKGVPTTLTGGQKAISLIGAGFSQGGNNPSNFTSKVSVLDLGYKSEQLPACESAPAAGCVYNDTSKSADLQYVGASAVPSSIGSKSGGVAWFGLSTYGNWATIGNTVIPFVDIDVNGDEVPDYEVQVQNAAGAEGTDLLEALLIDYNTNEALSIFPVNLQQGDVDTNVFDTNTLLVPVDPAALGMTDAQASFPISYSVSMYNASIGDVQDSTPMVPFDIANPAVQTANPLYYDQNGTAIPYNLGQTPTTATKQIAVTTDAKTKAKTVKALLIHLQGKSASRAEVVKLKG